MFVSFLCESSLSQPRGVQFSGIRLEWKSTLVHARMYCAEPNLQQNFVEDLHSRHSSTAHCVITPTKWSSCWCSKRPGSGSKCLEHARNNLWTLKGLILYLYSGKSPLLKFYKIFPYSNRDCHLLTNQISLILSGKSDNLQKEME